MPSHNRFKGFVLTGRVSALVILCLLLITVASPVVSQDDDAADDVADVVVDKRLSLQIEGPKEALAWGDEALVRLTAANIGADDIEAVALNLHNQPGVTWGEDFKGNWLELGDLAAGESRVIEGHVRVEGRRLDGTLLLFATLQGLDVEPAEARAELPVPPLPPEEVAIANEGSLVDTFGGRVQFAFPDKWNEKDARLTFQLQEEFRLPAGESGRLLLFTIEATADDALVESFDAPVAVEVDLSDLMNMEAAADHPPVVSTRESDEENWTTVESKFDPKTGLVYFTTTHFSAYQVTIEPEIWRLQYNPPGASAYSGAATYHYPIDAPPGIGGLAPDLSLNYSSRPAEGIRFPAVGQGFGAGWSLPEARIFNGNTGDMYTPPENPDWPPRKNFQNYNFSLILNGVTYYLTAREAYDNRSHGVYQALGEPNLRIEFIPHGYQGKPENSTDNVTGEFWRVKTPDGTTYTFGKTEGAEQVIWPVEDTDLRNGRQPRNKRFSAYNWKLDSVVDVHGNKLVYYYETSCGVYFAGGAERNATIEGGGRECTEVDTAVKEIHYNFTGASAQTKVVFTNQPLNNNQRRQEKSMTAGVFRPSKIEIMQGNDIISNYTFTYTEAAHSYAPWDISTQFWTLTSIARTGLKGAGALPPQTFAYEQNTQTCVDGACIKLLTRANNGYGAVTVLGYTNLTGTRWNYVSTVDTWDGVAAKHGTDSRPHSRHKYTPSVVPDDDPDTNDVMWCYDKPYHQNNNTCYSQAVPREGSEALIGFDKMTIETQSPKAPTGTQWTVLAKQELIFHNDVHWRLGRTYTDERFAPGDAKLSRSEYKWIMSQAGQTYKVMLDWEAHATYDPLSESRYVVKTIDYTYYPYNPAGGHYGALMERRELDQGSNDQASILYRCTEYEYAHETGGGSWLINYPLRETVYKETPVDKTCNVGLRVGETLYRYAGSANPTQKALDGRGLLTYVLRRTSASTDSYATEKRIYTAKGLPQEVITYSSLSSGTQYATDQRNVVSYEYTDLGMPKKVKTSATGIFDQIQTISYGAELYWLPISVADPNDIVTRYGYDSFGRLSKVFMPNDGLNSPTISYDYFDDKTPYFIAPLLVGIEYKGNAKSVERQFYDGLGRLVQTQIAGAEVDGANKDIVASTGYNAQGLAVCATVPYHVTPYNDYPNTSPFKPHTCASQTRTTTTYDALGRPTQVTTPDGATTKTVYGVTTHVNVDGKNKFQTTQVTDGNNHRVINYSNADGQLVLVRDHTGGGQYGAYSDARYSYDVMGNLTAVRRSAPNNNQPTSFLWQTSMGYDALGRKTTMSDPDMRDWGYVYDAAGNLARQEHRSGATVIHATCFYYDNLNRVLYRGNDATPANPCPAGAPTTGVPTTGVDHLASYTYGAYVLGFNNGRLTKVAWGPNPTQNNDVFEYDNEGRLVKQTRGVNDQTFVYEVTAYDVLDRPTAVKLPGGEVVTTTYDQEGVETLKAGTTTLVSKVGYNERGQMTLLKRANGAPDTTLSYHGVGKNFRLNTIVTGGAASLPDFTYSTYDAVGNLTHFVVNGHGYNYTYDELNRLKSVTGAITRDYTYDLLGNFVQVTKGSQKWDYTYASGNHSRLMGVTGLGLTVDPAAGYDTWGNMRKYTLEGKAYELTFNAENRLASLKAGTGQPTVFAYDADGQRVMTTYPDGTVVYTPFPDYEVTDPPGSGANTARTTYRLGGQIVAVQTKVGTAAGTIYYTYTDHLGNVSALSKLNGTFEPGSDARYDPFGTMTTTPATNPDITNHGFTGHRHNNTGTYDLKLIYMNARYYMPQIGRFISPDTIVPEPANPQSFNRYSYGFNNPVKYVDPSGHDPLGQEWRDEFEEAHGRPPEWYDEWIRLFSLAYPDEWNWSFFYRPDGSFKGFEGDVWSAIMSAPDSRSWDTMDAALTRLGAAYNSNELDFFVRDVGFLYAGLAGRSQNPAGPLPYFATGAFPGNPHVFLSPGTLNSGFYLHHGYQDGDANVHHWAWAFVTGYEIGAAAIDINSLREYSQASYGIDMGSLMVDVNQSDIAIGNAGVVMSQSFGGNYSLGSLTKWFGFLRNFSPSDYYFGYVP